MNGHDTRNADKRRCVNRLTTRFTGTDEMKYSDVFNVGEGLMMVVRIGEGRDWLVQPILLVLRTFDRK